MIRDGADRGDGEDDKIYYFFTEVSVEYEFFSKLLIPRVARVCKVGVQQQQQQPSSLVPTFCSYILFSTSVFFFLYIFFRVTLNTSLSHLCFPKLRSGETLFPSG